MRAELRRKIKKAIMDELRLSNHPYQSTDDNMISERILDEIAVILDAEGYPEIDFSQGKRPFLSADPLGADRKAREI